MLIDTPLGKQQALDELASVHLARLLSGASEAERRSIDDWIEADPRHAVAFARMQAAWEASERLRASPPRLSLAERARAPGQVVRRGLVGGLAAACAGAVAAGGWLYVRNSARYRTGVGERRTIALSDGSRVQLNTATSIEAMMRKDRREIRLLHGEALFNVAHDPSRPFFVDAASARLRAVGTAFNVRLRNEVVELTVTQGVVAVASLGTSARELPVPQFHAGEGAVIDAGTIAPTALGDQVLRQRTAWQQGVIELHGETLAQVVDEFNRYQAHPIVIGDARLADIRIGGRFQVDEADKFLAAISSSFSIEVTHTRDGGVLLTRPAESSAPG